MSFSYADQVFATFDGEAVELAEMSFDTKFDAKSAVKSMNPTGRPLGTKTSQGETTFKVKVPQRAGLPAWKEMDGVTVVFSQRVGGAPNFTALGAFYTGHQSSIDTEGEQFVDVDFGCLDWKEGI